jgi:LacI family transcriptional regulator
VRLRRLGRTGITVVLLDAKDPAERLSYVSVDDVQGGILAGRYLLDLGHRLIACVNGSHVRPWSEDRWNGMRRAVEERGLDPDRVLVRAPVETLVAAEGERAVDEFFASRHDVTAIFCDNDLLALGALHALRRRGIAVPGDVSVIGYDDDDFAEMISPTLSTVRQEPYKLGRCAAEVAVNAIAGHLALDRPSGQAFAPSLIARGSTARPRQGSMRAQAG